MKYKATNIFTEDYLTMRQYIRDLIADFLIFGIFYGRFMRDEGADKILDSYRGLLHS